MLMQRKVETADLAIACEISGPEYGSPIILLHGWPDDPRTWDGLLPDLHAAGWRTISPYLRGFGPTRFRRDTGLRTGQLAALGQDVLDLADALALRRFAVAGHDWGARAAYIASALAPERITACAAISVGWGTNDPGQSLELTQAQNYWYQWLMALERGAELVQRKRREFTRYIWDIWNPGWTFPEADFAVTAASFDNPDWADVTLHSYRVRWGLAERDPAYDAIETRLAADPVIRVPSLVIHGAADPCNAPATSEGKEHLFAASYRRSVLEGLGHFPQRQSSPSTLAALMPFLGETSLRV
jgi:pimeloyl-ACP methyl ester carboxylesterase